MRTRMKRIRRNRSTEPTPKMRTRTSPRPNLIVIPDVGHPDREKMMMSLRKDLLAHRASREGKSPKTNLKSPSASAPDATATSLKKKPPKLLASALSVMKKKMRPMIHHAVKSALDELSPKRKTSQNPLRRRTGAPKRGKALTV